MPHTSDRRDGCRVSDEWTFRGMRMAVLENDLLRVTVALDRGAEIVEFRSLRNGFDPLLRLPGGIRDPRSVVASSTVGGDPFLDWYAGGWQEILPNGGPQVSWRGAAYGQHGEVSLVPWSVEIVTDEPHEVAIVCRVRALRTPLALERRMTIRADRSALFLDERLTNEGGEDLDVMWGHHVAFGRTLLDDGARIATSARRVRVEDPMDGFEPRRVAPGHDGPWPMAPGSDGSSLVDLSVVPTVAAASGREMAYLSGFDGGAWYAIWSREKGFALTWDGALFEYLWLWQEFRAGTGYPWWKRVHCVALGPWTSFPTLGLPEAVRRGTQLVIPAGATIETSLVAVAFEPAGRDVTGLTPDGEVRFSRRVVD